MLKVGAFKTPSSFPLENDVRSCVVDRGKMVRVKFVARAMGEYTIRNRNNRKVAILLFESLVSLSSMSIYSVIIIKTKFKEQKGRKVARHKC